MIRKKWIALYGIAVVLILAAVLAMAMAWIGAARGGVIVLQSVTMTPDSETAPGAVVTATVDFSVPWGQNLEKVEFRPGAGIIGVGAPEFGLEKIAWRTRMVRIKVPLRAYRTGTLPAGLVAATFERPMIAAGARRTVEEVNLPDVTAVSQAVPENTELPLAGVLTPPRNNRGFWMALGIAAAVVLLTSVLLWQWVRRRQTLRMRAQPPWELAAAELAGLRRQAERGERPAAWCVARLTDVVRDYLSARFHLPVRHQTTGEFLRELKRPDSPLTTEQGRNLADFMTAADLVKFAGQTPESGYLENAIAKAEILVDETRPHEEQGENPAAAEGQVGK